MVTRSKRGLRPGIKLIALVSILGIAAYLLFIPKNTEPQRVRARRGDAPAIPQAALHSTSLAPMPIGVTLPESQTIAPPPHPVTTFDLITGLPAVLEKASTEQNATADQLLSFVSTGNMANIRDLTPEQIKSLADLLTTELGTEAVAAAAESYFGLPSASFLAHDNPAEVLTDLVLAVQSEAGPTNAAPVVFSDRVEPDGAVTGNVHVIPAGTKRVYAAFENAGALQNMDRVLAVWRNPSDDRMVFTEYEPVRVGATYNYVWLELDDGWPVGFYQLDLFHPSRTSQLLASRSFNVR